MAIKHTALYLCNDATDGHVHARTAANARVDSLAGPRDFIVRFYLGCGAIVFGLDGRAIGMAPTAAG